METDTRTEDDQQSALVDKTISLALVLSNDEANRKCQIPHLNSSSDPAISSSHGPAITHNPLHPPNRPHLRNPPSLRSYHVYLTRSNLQDLLRHPPRAVRHSTPHISRRAASLEIVTAGEILVRYFEELDASDASLLHFCGEVRHV